MTISKDELEEKVSKAISTSRVLSMLYKKKNNTTVRRQIEPYEIKMEEVVDDYAKPSLIRYLYGYDITPNLPSDRHHIKRWICSRILQLQVMKNKKYVWRY